MTIFKTLADEIVNDRGAYSFMCEHQSPGLQQALDSHQGISGLTNLTAWGLTDGLSIN